jgi:MoaA/NifB/PqqE/SkfB family radical SAM enzyme
MLRLADVLVAMRPKSVQISGGEPMLVRDLFEVAARIRAGGVRLAIYLSGFGVDDEAARRLAQLFSWIHVSVDGGDSRSHDAIRGRRGSFDEAMAALAALDRAGAEVERERKKRVSFGIDCTIVRSNWKELDRFCTELSPRFPRLRFLNLRVALASGLSTRESYAERELLTEEEMAFVAEPELAARLRSITPASVERVSVENALLPPMDGKPASPPELMHVEPDGLVRGMPLYEGTVGNLLEEPAETLWQRSLARHADPFVTSALSGIRDMREWAAAARKIDQHFAAPQDLLRISRRKPHTEETASP